MDPINEELPEENEEGQPQDENEASPATEGGPENQAEQPDEGQGEGPPGPVNQTVDFNAPESRMHQTGEGVPGTEGEGQAEDAQEPEPQNEQSENEAAIRRLYVQPAETINARRVRFAPNVDPQLSDNRRVLCERIVHTARAQGRLHELLASLR